MESNSNTNKNLLYEIFDTIINESTWGSSKFGGPIWVMDFRMTTLKERFTEGHLREYIDTTPSWQVTFGLSEMAMQYIYYHRICNVLVIDGEGDNDVSTNLLFFSLYSFNNLLTTLLKQSTPDPAPPRKISYILNGQSPKIQNDDYIWVVHNLHTEELLQRHFPIYLNCTYADGVLSFMRDGEMYFFLPYILPQFLSYEEEYVSDPRYYPKGIPRRFVRSDNGAGIREVPEWEIFLPNLIYDCMELISMKYFTDVQYPLIAYDDVEKPNGYGNIEQFIEHIADRPHPRFPEVKNPNLWHKEFFPKQYWKIREFREE